MCSTAVLAPKAVPSPGLFKGDHDSLVDALVAACEPQSLAHRLPQGSFGRTLVPYSATGFFDMPEPTPEAAPKSRTPAPKRKGSPPQPRAESARTPVSSSGNNPRLSSSPPSSNKMSRPASGASPKYMASPVVPAAAFACPAWFSSPKPEALPRPTSRLLAVAAGM